MQVIPRAQPRTGRPLRRRQGAGCGRSASVACAAERRKQDVVLSPGDTVLVAGATGGVGQILTKKLVEVSAFETSGAWPNRC